MGYFCEEKICWEDREDYDVSKLEAIESEGKRMHELLVARKDDIVHSPKKYKYIFKVVDRDMYFGENGPAFNWHMAKRYTLSEAEAIKKARSMSLRGAYKWTELKIG